METEPSNTLNLPHQPWERIPVVKCKEGDAGGGIKVEGRVRRCKADHVRNGSGLFCEGTA